MLLKTWEHTLLRALFFGKIDGSVFEKSHRKGGGAGIVGLEKVCAYFHGCCFIQRHNACMERCDVVALYEIIF
jgi:hypothetical protein